MTIETLLSEVLLAALALGLVAKMLEESPDAPDPAVIPIPVEDSQEK